MTTRDMNNLASGICCSAACKPQRRPYNPLHDRALSPKPSHATVRVPKQSESHQQTGWTGRSAGSLFQAEACSHTNISPKCLMTTAFFPTACSYSGKTTQGCGLQGFRFRTPPQPQPAAQPAALYLHMKQRVISRSIHGFSEVQSETTRVLTGK